jgi:quinol monooxygenase YgiN
MYARVTTIKVDPARLGELPAKIKELSPAAKALPGVIDIYAAWRGDGQGTVVAVYNSKADADAAAAKIQAIWGTLAGLLQGAPATDPYDTVEHIVG